MWAKTLGSLSTICLEWASMNCDCTGYCRRFRSMLLLIRRFAHVYQAYQAMERNFGGMCRQAPRETRLWFEREKPYLEISKQKRYSAGNHLLTVSYFRQFRLSTLCTVSCRFDSSRPFSPIRRFNFAKMNAR